MKINILVVGTHEEIMQTLMRLLHKNEDWQATAAMNETSAMALFTQQHFDVVLLSSGLDEQTENNICTFCRNKNAAVKIIQHYGGGSGLLYGELMQAFA